jgi:BirA family biotin operon repressor/biotin-[acetyl-CoA-carboxylase] ligase
MNISVLHFETLESTNTEAAEQARRGADEGLCVIADQQTAGRGRLGRRWTSESGAGLYLSIVLRPKLETSRLPLVTLMTGVAVSDALTELGLKPDIKWVNDVLVREKKICGILAEAVQTARGLAVVVGIGINLNSHNIPAELSDTATSLREELGRLVTADEMASVLTSYLNYFYDILSADTTGEIVSHWRDRSTYHSEKHVRVTVGGETFEGVTEGVEPDGALRVRTGRQLRVIQAGDVERLRKVSSPSA